MGKKKKDKVIEMSADKLLELTEIKKTYGITKASINDDFCNYSFEVYEGKGVGDICKITGSGIVDQDMIEAFQVFNRHLACMDDVFLHSKIDIENIDLMENHALTALYSVNGFSIHGSSDNESISLSGSKHCHTTGGRIDFSTNRIALDALSAYRWYNELKTASDNARKEVELYREGKCTSEEKVEKSNSRQKNLLEEIDDATSKESEEMFEKNKL